MTASEAIKYTEEVAEKHKKKLKVYENIEDEDKFLFMGEETECRLCASELQQLAEWLKELKQLRKHTRWIQCNERLPECDVFVLATCKEPYSNLCAYLKILRRTNDGSWTDNLDYYSPDSVIAWMPLREPYKAESEDKK